MSKRSQSSDADYHTRRAAAERRATLKSNNAAAAAAHRQLALEHELAAIATKRSGEVQVDDDARFLSFVLREAVPTERDGSADLKPE